MNDELARRIFLAQYHEAAQVFWNEGDITWSLYGKNNVDLDVWYIQCVVGDEDDPLDIDSLYVTVVSDDVVMYYPRSDDPMENVPNEEFLGRFIKI